MKIKGDEFKDSPSQHLKIYDAIKDRNPEKASELMLNHVRCTYDGI
jgi:DNA-binding GntR family transcriptional regulator